MNENEKELITEFQAVLPDRYQIGSVLGQGGMGLVFGAFDIELSREVAIKVHCLEGVQADETQKRFLREAHILSKLDHDNIVKIYTSAIDKKGNPYSVMEYLQGNALSQVLMTEGLDPRELQNLCLQVLSGLASAHEQKIVHRDLKPSNIMRCQGQEYTYKLIDFGIARLETSQEQIAKTLTKTSMIMGSPKYMSPEQCRGERGDQLSDIYSFACILFECITGAAPFQGDNAFEIMYKHISESPARLYTESKDLHSLRLSNLVNACLEKSPQARPPSASQLRNELLQIFGDEPEKIEILQKKRRELNSGRKTFSKAGILGGICLAILVSVLFAAVYIIHAEQTRKESKRYLLQSDQEKIKLQIEKARSRFQRWGELSEPLRSRASMEACLSDLFTLGRTQLLSAQIQDFKDAEEIYDKALSLTQQHAEEWKNDRIEALALKSKAQWKQAKFQKAIENFETALAMAASNKELRLDILLERARMFVKMGKYPDALKDSSEAIEIFDKGLDRLASIDLSARVEQAEQKLDSKGVNRSDMLNDVAIELRLCRPHSSMEAEQMLRLSNALAARLQKSPHRHKQEKMSCWRFSKSLLTQIKDPELKAQTTQYLILHPPDDP